MLFDGFFWFVSVCKTFQLQCYKMAVTMPKAVFTAEPCSASIFGSGRTKTDGVVALNSDSTDLFTGAQTEIEHNESSY